MRNFHRFSSALALGVLCAFPCWSWSQMQTTDVQQGTLNPVKLDRTDPATKVLWDLWSDRISAAQARWTDRLNRPLPVTVLLTEFDVGPNHILVTTLDTLFDCEAAPNGRDASGLVTRCPLRILMTGSGGSSIYRSPNDVCSLWVDPTASQGPSPAQNHVSAQLDVRTMKLELRTTQYGRAVPECDQTVTLSLHGKLP